MLDGKSQGQIHARSKPETVSYECSEFRKFWAILLRLQERLGSRSRW